ncbi:MAG TPA: hypothetical protein VGS58_07830, partial [Candidatus Sulfopaludibacter sp.]|nr:hypothetical protein [Candidatus Sulfopaludibacter sp.]
MKPWTLAWFVAGLAITAATAQVLPDKPVTVHPAVESVPVREGAGRGPGTGLGATAPTPPAARGGGGGARGGRAGRGGTPPPIPLPPPAPEIKAAGAAVEQTAQGKRPAIPALAGFDGLGEGFTGREFPGAANATDGGGGRGGAGRGGIDISLAVGPDHVFEILNGNMAVFTKKGRKYGTTGKLLYGPAPNDTVFAGFGVRCGVTNNSDTVVRYDQLADRWLIVLPVFTRPPDNPQGPYAMCYAVSATPDPLGPYYRYEFQRPLFPDYPRPAVWPDGYYNPTSTSDNMLPEVVTQKHECVADRNKMLQGLPATEQCVVIDGGVFMLNADVDGKRLPPAGAPNIMMSTGGTQLLKIFEDDGIYFYKVHVDWSDPAKTAVSAPRKIAVAPYHYLCDGQLSNCVSQPGTQRRLDAQGDKLIQRLVYRNFGGHESILAEHSVATAAHGGGVRWYEFRLNQQRDPVLYQQSTYAPGGFYRWLGSMAMDRKGDIGIGYSFGGDPNYPGQRFAARMAKDPKGRLTFHESVLVEGQASQTGSLRWEDYTNIVVDPSDDCTFWFVGNYLKGGATSSTTRIGSFAVPG